MMLFDRFWQWRIDKLNEQYDRHGLEFAGPEL